MKLESSPAPGQKILEKDCMVRACFYGCRVRVHRTQGISRPEVHRGGVHRGVEVGRDDTCEVPLADEIHPCAHRPRYLRSPSMSFSNTSEVETHMTGGWNCPIVGSGLQSAEEVAAGYDVQQLQAHRT